MQQKINCERNIRTLGLHEKEMRRMEKRKYRVE
jgi:hypothetical protein